MIKNIILFLGIILIIFIISLHIIKIPMYNERILFLGSSIIYQWNTSIIDPKSINLGVMGLTTDDLRQFYYPIIKKIKKIKTIILYIGSNDVVQNKTKETQIINNIIQFLFLLKNIFPSINIIYLSIIQSPKRTDEQRKKINYINKKIEDFSKLYSSWIFFCNINNELNSIQCFQPDKNHLSKYGYEILTKKIKEILY